METRRSALLKALSISGALLAWQSLRPRAAMAAGARMILAKAVAKVPLEPEAAAWQQASPVEVPLSPQVIVKPRVYNVGVNQVRVRAVYDPERLGLLLEWETAQRNVGLGQSHSFGDAAAVQFPADLARSMPHFAMGEPGKPVIIYQWKADWEFGPEYDVEEQYPGMVVDFYPYAGKEPGALVEGRDYGAKAAAPWPAVLAYNPAWWAKNPVANPELKQKTPVEKLTAAGFSSLTHQPPEEQDGLGKAVHKDDGWHVVISIPRKQAGGTLTPGDVLPLNFAVWDGANNERGGEKAVGSWSFLALERTQDISVFALPPLVAAAVGGLLWALMRLIQRGQREV